MSQPTVSEKLFEAHCASRGVHLRRIPETALREPDYELLLCPLAVVAEVKQINANRQDLSPEVLGECQETGMGIAPVDRVRGMIAAGYPQLRRYSEQGYPGLLVTYNNAGLVNYIDEHTVTKALFGSPNVYFELTPAGTVRWTGMGFGGGRRVTSDSCRALSGLCVLEAGSRGVTRLHVYHNPYSAIPIDPKQLAQVADYQYAYDDPHGRKNPALTPRLLEV